ncbi:hypothetical protein SEA_WILLIAMSTRONG_20 [Microbacterium phage WilliamStrong]|nr:hypothetical protein SEA_WILLIAMSTRONG_20 [Microbacterium phage WilliamStrong]
MRYALVKDNVACNVILWDGDEEYEAPEGYEVVPVDDQVSAGWVLEGHTWTAPPRDVEIVEPAEDPEVLLAKEQAATALIALGVTPATARTIVGLANEA